MTTELAIEAMDPFECPDDPNFARVPKYLWDYAYDHSDLVDAAEDLRRFLIDMATEASIPFYTIEARSKKLTSFRDKALKKKPDGTPKYDDPSAQIRDCIAARAILFTTRARDDFAELLVSRVEVHERVNPGTIKHNGYDSEHFIVTELRYPSDKLRYATLTRFLNKYAGLELQLRSVAAHAWAEYEHDVRYKSAAYSELPADARGQIDQWFVEAGGMRRVMDDLFDKVQGLLYPTGEAPPGSGDGGLEADGDLASEIPDDDEGSEVLDISILRNFVSARYPESAVGDDAAIEELLIHLNAAQVSTVQQLDSSLAAVEPGQVARLMDYPTEPTGVRQLDDEMLAALTDRYVTATDDDKRRQLLHLRLARVRGKFAIYSIYDGERARRPVSAARAVRELVGLISKYLDDDPAVPGAVASSISELNPSSKPRPIRTPRGTLWVATNMTRAWAESVMSSLLLSAPGSGIRITRAGDLIGESPEAQDGEHPAS